MAFHRRSCRAAGRIAIAAAMKIAAMISQPVTCMLVARKVKSAGVQTVPRVLPTLAMPW
jgi:uncharacterized membrane protein